MGRHPFWPPAFWSRSAKRPVGSGGRYLPDRAAEVVDPPAGTAPAFNHSLSLAAGSAFRHGTLRTLITLGEGASRAGSSLNPFHICAGGGLRAPAADK